MMKLNLAMAVPQAPSPLTPKTRRVIRSLELDASRTYTREEIMTAMRNASPPVDPSARMAVDLELAALERAEKAGKVAVSDWPSQVGVPSGWGPKVHGPADFFRAAGKRAVPFFHHSMEAALDPQHALSCLPDHTKQTLERIGVTQLPIDSRELSERATDAGMSISDRIELKASLMKANASFIS